MSQGLEDLNITVKFRVLLLRVLTTSRAVATLEVDCCRLELVSATQKYSYSALIKAVTILGYTVISALTLGYERYYFGLLSATLTLLEVVDVGAAPCFQFLGTATLSVLCVRN